MTSSNTIPGVLPSNRRGELIGTEVVKCSERQAPRLDRQMYGRKRTGRLRGYHNHRGRRMQNLSIPAAAEIILPGFLFNLFRRMYSHDPVKAERQAFERNPDHGRIRPGPRGE